MRNFFTSRRLPTTISLAAALAAAPHAKAAAPPTRPRLVVVVVVDQLRPDYLDRFSDLFRPAGRGATAGGFRFLQERGADFPRARYRHFPLFTGPGHAVVLTGGYPYKTGIIGNDWYSKAAHAGVYCVGDPTVTVIGAGPGSKSKPMSPANFRSTTVGDELKLATGGAAKVVSLSLKDRAAILLGGHMADSALWFDESTGNFISSSFYCKTGQLPKWTQDLNAQRLPDKYFGRTWAMSLPAAAYARQASPRPPQSVPIPFGVGATFPHRIDGGLTAPGPDFYKALDETPYANDVVLQAAETAVAAEGLGQDETPDLLAVNLSPNDYAGHVYGPDSPEILDITAQTDRQLSDFFRFLNRTVPGGLDNVTIALTADHGVAPMPEEMTARGFSAGRLLEADMEKAADAALDARFGPADWVGKFVKPYLYLNDAAIAASKADPAAVRRVAADALAAFDGVYAAYTSDQVAEGRLPGTDLANHIYNGFYPKRAGDVVVVTDTGWFTEQPAFEHNTTHGTVYAYDTEVPLLLEGFGIKAGVHHESVSPADLAPTLSTLLGLVSPSACDGTVLDGVLAK